MKKLLLMVSVLMVLAACGNGVGKAPEGVRQEFYEDSINVVRIFEDKMNNGKEIKGKNLDLIIKYSEEIPSISKKPIEYEIHYAIAGTYMPATNYDRKSNITNQEDLERYENGIATAKKL